MTTDKNGKKAPKVNKKMVEKIKQQDERIVTKLLAAMEKGGIRWVQDWKPAGLRFDHGNPVTGSTYSGTNQAACALVAAMELQTTNNNWATAGEIRKNGWKISDDATPVYIRKVRRMTGCKRVTTTDANTGEVVTEDVYFNYMAVVGGWAVYNHQQLEGDGVIHVNDAVKAATSDEFTKAADRLIATSRCPIYESGNRAYYRPSADFVQVPPRWSFGTTEGFLRTLIHEMVHSTAPAVNREDKARRFGDKHYAFEELVAELGAAFGAAYLGFDISAADYPANYAEQHAAYLKHWAGKADGDRTKAIYSAMTLAMEAVAYIMERYDGTDTEDAAA